MYTATLVLLCFIIYFISYKLVLKQFITFDFLKMTYTFPKKEKLKHKKVIEKLFTEGQTVSKFPIKLIYTKTSDSQEVPIVAGVSVAKRKFKNAVDRNRIKRQLREAYRLQKNEIFNKITTPYAFMFLYLGNEKPESSQIQKAMLQVLAKFSQKEFPDTSSND